VTLINRGYFFINIDNDNELILKCTLSELKGNNAT
jgi:hypothetical protein